MLITQADCKAELCELQKQGNKSLYWSGNDTENGGRVQATHLRDLEKLWRKRVMAEREELA